MRLIDADALEKFLKRLRRELPKESRDFFTRDEMILNFQQYVHMQPTIDAVPVVRCVECIWWQDRQVQLIDGSCRDYMPDEPWSVTCDVGINVGSHCTKHGFDDKSGSWFWAAANDYCSRGERERTMTND